MSPPPENAFAVDSVGADLSAAVQDLPVVQQEAHMRDAPIRIPEKGEVPEAGLFQREFIAQKLLLGGVPRQRDALCLEYRLSES